MDPTLGHGRDRRRLPHDKAPLPPSSRKDCDCGGDPAFAGTSVPAICLHGRLLIQVLLPIMQFLSTEPDLYSKLDKRDIAQGLLRHAARDWGDVPSYVRLGNKAALKNGGRVYSSFTDRKGVKFVVSTKPGQRYPLVYLLAKKYY